MISDVATSAVCHTFLILSAQTAVNSRGVVSIGDGVMPAIVKFTLIAALLAAVGYVTLYMLAVHFEPEQTEVRKSLPVRIQR